MYLGVKLFGLKFPLPLVMGFCILSLGKQSRKFMHTSTVFSEESNEDKKILYRWLPPRSAMWTVVTNLRNFH